MLEQSQTQLLADYMASYERAAHQEIELTGLQAALGRRHTAESGAADALAAELAALRDSHTILGQQHDQQRLQLESLLSSQLALNVEPSPELASLREEVTRLTAANQQLVDQLAGAKAETERLREAGTAVLATRETEAPPAPVASGLAALFDIPR